MTFLDPLMVVQKAEAEARLPFVFPEEFYVKDKEQKDGSQKPEEWVLVKKKGMQNGQVTPMRWRDVERTPDLLVVLRPYYENWKKGQETPISGTPLDAWIADAGLVKVLNSVNIRSVEDFSQVEDHVIARLNVPGIREKQNRAKAFLDAQKSTAKVSGEVATLRDENDNLRRDIAELRALIEQHAIKKQEETVVPRKRGRPPKSDIERIAI
jgi:hypothetical protein